VELTEPFEEAAPVPCLLLVFPEPAAFLSVLRAPGGGFGALLSCAAALHPGCSLQALVVGLDAHLKAKEGRAPPQAAAAAAAAHAEVLRLQLSAPALQLRKVANLEAAALHVLSLTRALGQQPYKRSHRDDALAAGSAGNSFAAAAAVGMRDLGPGAKRFAQCLARVQGAGGGHVWVSGIAGVGWGRNSGQRPRGPAALPLPPLPNLPNASSHHTVPTPPPRPRPRPRPQAVAREFGGLGALTQAVLREQACGRDPCKLMSELRDARSAGAQRRLGTALAARLVALVTASDPDALVGQGDE
jgi:hypothetical protein